MAGQLARWRGRVPALRGRDEPHRWACRSREPGVADGGPSPLEIAFGPLADFWRVFLCGCCRVCDGGVATGSSKSRRVVPRCRRERRQRACCSSSTRSLPRSTSRRRARRTSEHGDHGRQDSALSCSCRGLVAIDTSTWQSSIRRTCRPSPQQRLLIFAFAGIEAALVPGGGSAIRRARSARDSDRDDDRHAAHMRRCSSSRRASGPVLAKARHRRSPMRRDRDGRLGSTAAAHRRGDFDAGLCRRHDARAPRTLFAFARDGFLPAVFARTHPVYRSPTSPSSRSAPLFRAGDDEHVRAGPFWRILDLGAVRHLCVAPGSSRKDVRSGGTPFRVPMPGLVTRVACAASPDADERHASEWLAFAIALVSGRPVSVTPPDGGPAR